MTDNHGKYGPRTAVVEKMIERAGRLTLQEARDLADAFPKVTTSLGDVAYAAAWNAAGDVGPYAAHTAAKVAWKNVYTAIAADTTADADWDWDARCTSYAAADAALVAAVAHLEGRCGLTRKGLETIASPWRSVINDVDPLKGIGDD